MMTLVRCAYLLRRPVVVGAVICGLALALASQAQEPCVKEGSETESELLEKAEIGLQLSASKERFDVNIARKAERQLKSILERNPTTPYRQRIEEDLRPVQETLAQHHLQIASFYMSRSHGGSKGAQSRLLEIVRVYPRFSQMDEVLLRLGTLAIQDERPDEAGTYLWKLVCDYPTSSNRALAFEKLAEVGFRSWQGCYEREQ